METKEYSKNGILYVFYVEMQEKFIRISLN